MFYFFDIRYSSFSQVLLRYNCQAAWFKCWVSLVAQMVKNLPAMWETQVLSLGQEDSPGEGKGNPLQYSCLENSLTLSL